MILGFIHGFSTRRIEGRARGHDPVFGRLGSTAAGANLYAAGIDVLLRFAFRQIELGIDGAFRRQILPLLCRLCVAHNYQLAVRVLLQVLGYIIQDSLAGVVDAPRLLLIREVALAEFGGLRRRRRRIFHRRLRRSLTRQTARVGAGCGDRNRARVCSVRRKSRRAATSGDGTAARGPIRDRTPVTPSGLVQLQLTVTLAPACTLEGLAVQLMVGGFFGGNGLMV